jgi:putative DNA primase/helicase
MITFDSTSATHEELDAKAAETETKYDPSLKVSPPGQPMPNVRRFLADQYGHPDCTLLVQQGGQFYGYDGRSWPPIEDPLLRSQLYRFFEPRWFADDKERPKPFAPTMRKIADHADALAALTVISTQTPTPSWFGTGTVPGSELISCENGLIHWPTRKLLPHSPKFYVHHAVPFAFDSTAPQPKRWLAFLNQLWGSDQDSIDCLQETFGYLLSGDTGQQKMFLMVGPKRGGKGTIARVLTRLLGKHNVAGPTLSSLGTNFGLQDLIAKPIAIVSDARLGTKSDHALVTERLLSISGEDLQNVDRKFMAPWSGQLPTRFVIFTNELPRLSDSSGALASRFIVLMLTNSFYGNENPRLTDELCEELPSIFNWALDGLARLRARGRFKPPATSREAIQALEDLASPVGAFLRDRCSVGPECSVEIATMYATYRTWCEDTGRHAVNQQLFGRDLRAVRPEVQVRQLGEDRRRHYVGIRIGHSRDSRVNLHCSAHTADPPETSVPQSINTRESREHSNEATSRRHVCRHCGERGETLMCTYDDVAVQLHRNCIDAWRAQYEDRVACLAAE